METRSVKELFFKKNEKFVNSNCEIEDINTLRERKLKKYIDEQLDKYEENFKKLCDEFDERFNDNEWVLMRDDYCYISEITSLMPDLNEVECYSQSSSENFNLNKDDLSFGDFVGSIPTKEEAKVFLSDKNPYKKNNDKIVCDDREFFGITCENNCFLVTYTNDKGKICRYNNQAKAEILTVPIYRFNGVNSEKKSASQILLYWISNKLNPIEFKNDSNKKSYEDLKKFYKIASDMIISVDTSIVFSDRNNIIDYFCKLCLESESKVDFLPDAKDILNTNEFEADDVFIDFFEYRLTKSDYIRANLSTFEANKLYEANSGHWDIFDYEQPEDSSEYFTVKLPEDKSMSVSIPDVVETYAAIDFGTKSTVVAYEDPNNNGSIIPIKVGYTFNSDDSIDEYENPSVIEFINFYKFKDDYTNKEYRPYTQWKDLTVSHDALLNMKDIQLREDSDKYDSFLTDLKSWCSRKSGKKNNCKLRRRESGTGKLVEFDPFSESSDAKINPLEIYAYFLGLYINQMSKARVFSNYRMSFPVTFEKELKDKIIKSFEKGIRKSFPTILLSEDKDFREKIDDSFIKQGLSEPSAYAITALDRYYFGDRLYREFENGNKDKKFYYAVFDFGGGTTDFDFGYYTKLENDEHHDYELNHFGSIYGVSNLGGEKLLKYLAFELFKANKDKLKSLSKNGKKIQFTTYDGYEDKDLYDLDELIAYDGAVSANLNMLIVMEKLRWVWEDPNAEKHEPQMKDFKYGVLKVDLYDTNDNKERVDLTIPKKEVVEGEEGDPIAFFKDLLCEKIEKGISTFFESMKEAFRKSNKDFANIDEISIFLAGNSTKSILFRDILNKFIKEQTKDILDKTNFDKQKNGKFKNAKEILELDKNSDLKFVLYPPLGTSESKAMLEKLDEEAEIPYEGQEPTCKTGVAFGLLKDNVKVNDSIFKSSDVPDTEKFRFYVGRERDRRFAIVVLEGDTDIDNEWKELYTVVNNVNLYKFIYSRDAAAGSRTMPARRAKPLQISIKNPQNGTKIFIRATKPDEIEWKVARSENIEPDDPKLTGHFTLNE